MILAATSGHTYWWIALAIGLVAALIVDEAVVQDGYMNALTDGYGGAA